MQKVLCALTAVTAFAAALAATSSPRADEAPRAIDQGKLPHDYRDWKLISVAREEGNLDDIRAILGNEIAIKAYREGTRPFPDGSIIARLAWALVPSEVNNKAFGKDQSFVAGRQKNGIQFMIKDSTRFAATGGWGYAQFDEGKPITEPEVLQNCFVCHQAVAHRDFVFTDYAQ